MNKSCITSFQNSRGGDGGTLSLRAAELIMGEVLKPSAITDDLSLSFYSFIHSE